MGGDYDERVRVTMSGLSNARITYQAEGTVSIRGFHILADNITIRGFRVSDAPCHWTEGFGIFSQGNGTLIEDNDVYDCARGGISLSGSRSIARDNRSYRNGMVGIRVSGDNHLVENNEVWGTIQNFPDCILEGADADGIRFFGSGHVFRGNYIHDITFDDPLVVNAHIDAFQTWTGASDCLFEGNRISLPVEQTANEKGVGWMLRDATNMTMINNVLDVHTGVNTSPGNNNGIKFYHNTLVSRRSFVHWNAGFIFPPNADVRNNIFIDFYQAFHDEDGNDIIAANAVWNSDGSTPRGSGESWGRNPLFVDFRSGNYHLQEGSPLIDAAIPLPDVIEDFDGVGRPKGQGPDIGAYEYPAAHNPTPPPTSTPAATGTPTPPPTPTPQPDVSEPDVDDDPNALALSTTGGSDRPVTQNTGEDIVEGQANGLKIIILCISAFVGAYFTTQWLTTKLETEH
jgi:hypothetical protein